MTATGFRLRHSFVIRHSPFHRPGTVPAFIGGRMKKLLVSLVVLVAVATAAFVVYKKTIGAHVAAALLVPGETLLFVAVPNVPRTALRWPKTGLAQMLAEPEMEKFLEKSRSQPGLMQSLDEKLAQLVRLAPREVFVAVTSIDGPTPKWIAGCAFLGRKKEAVTLLAEPRAVLKAAWPAGKSDLATHGTTEVETFTYGDAVVAEAFQGNWYLVSNDVALLHQTLDAAALPNGAADALGTREVFKKATAPLPADGDTLVFAQLGTLTDRVKSLLVASGQSVDPKQLAELQRMQAVAWGTKLEGAQVRDTIYLLAPGGAAEVALPRNALAFSAAETFLYYGMALPAKIEMPESAGLLGGYLTMLAPMEKALAEKGLKWADLSVAFGPELGVVADWGAEEPAPSALLAVDVRDAAKARAFVDVFTASAPGTPGWGRSEKDGATLFQSPTGAGLLPVSPSLALTGKFLVLGFSPVSVGAALTRLKSGQAGIAQTPAYQGAVKTVGAPTSGFGYLDMKTLIERSYATLRPMLALSLATAGEGEAAFDAGKLPATETISRHFTPSVYSQRVTAEGTLVESSGTLTFNQVLLGAIGGGVAAAMPLIESTLSAGLKLDDDLLSPPPAKPTPAHP